MGASNFDPLDNSDNTPLLNGGTRTLIIDDLSESDSGVYSAKVTRLIADTNTCWVYGYTADSCDSIAMPLLTHNAIARPVTFEVDVQGVSNM